MGQDGEWHEVAVHCLLEGIGGKSGIEQPQEYGREAKNIS